MITRIADAAALNIQWHKSSHSGADSNCVESGQYAASTAVRDSKAPGGPAILFRPAAWSDFIQNVRN